MTLPAKPSALERTAGSLATEVALTGLAAYVGGPLAALVPPLAKSLAAGRQLARIQSALAEVDVVLQRHAREIERLTDEQYQIICEAVGAMLQTTHQAKLDLLRTVIERSLTQSSILPIESAALARVVRDISPEEAEFLHRSFASEGVVLQTPKPNEIVEDQFFRILPTSTDAVATAGLVSLGLLVLADPTYGALNVLRFTPLAGKLLTLVRTG